MTNGDDVLSSWGPVEFVALTFPGTRIDPAVVDEIAAVAARQQITVLDLVYLAKDVDGTVTQVDVDEDLAGVGLAGLALEATALISEDDLQLVRDSLEPGTSAALIVYEETWARRLAARVREQGGEVALHVQVPRDVLERAVEAAV
ncbi:DUF6325 family protein [Prescottella sp. R16]|uniref:DUF6325 family protein n=1 Tax=Prescottella sp. R16 TaxID=3064529 RepID=UPI00272E3CB4|nr:DUF6325 family protein [Prescottella sp. R16]